ncbi:MAG: recombination protein RecR [Deltaproteobacteria bacterium]|nr:recombination protein RecR [Deltaproteobacteria bacterium]
MPADPIQVLVGQLSRLPGIGERTATRLVLHLLRNDRGQMRALAEALVEVSERVHECARCCTITADPEVCPLCRDPKRDPKILCVVSSIQDQTALEATLAFRGRYHILHGTLSPLDGVGPDDLRIRSLFQRLSTTDSEVQEIIVATPPTVDGEATALYLARQLSSAGVQVSRIASGIPVGGDLQFADRLTLAKAIEARQTLA